MNISSKTISSILHGLDFEPPVSTAKINYCVGTNDKMTHFQWMDGISPGNKEATSWVVSGPGVNRHQIIKGSLNFLAKAW